MSIRLSERLSAIAERIPHGARVIDVGTDHARLPVWLAQTGRAEHIYAADIRRGPLEGAARLVAETGVGSRVTLRQTDGLNGFGAEDADTVVIAGMGGETMAEILSASPWIRDGVRLLLSPQSKQDVLRRWLCGQGFTVTSEALVRDAGKIYPILEARAGAAPEYTRAELFTGKFEKIRGDALFHAWLSQLTQRAAKAAPYDDAAAALLSEFEVMKERLDAMPTVGGILELLQEKAPVEARLDFDNVGLLVGRAERRVGKVMAALDITDEVISEAISEDADLIVSHHPLFFELKAVTDRSWTGERTLRLAENRIAAICMHTNLDASRGGVNDALLDTLGLTYTGELDEETMIGRVGELPQAVSMPEFLKTVKASLSANGLRYHNAGRPVKRVAVCGGSGGGEIALAHAAGCDTYVTADIKYDPFLEAKHLGVNLIDADHFCTENVVVPVLCAWIREVYPEVEVMISRIHGQTAQFY